MSLQASLGPGLRWGALSPRRDDRQQQIGFAAGSSVDHRLAAENVGGPVLAIGMEPRARTAGAEARTGVAARSLEILAGDRHCQAVAGWQHYASRPDLDLEFVNLTRGQRVLIVMGVERPIRQGPRLVELPV